MSTTSNFTQENTGLDAAQALGEHIRGRNVLITGPSVGGLGFEAAKAIVTQQPGLLILGGRSKEKYEEAAAQLKAVAPSVPLRFVEIDTASVESAKAAAKIVLGYPEPLHILVNNSGVAALPALQASPEGIELQIATNHIGQFIFTNLLVPKLKQSGPGCRIITCASRAHRLGYGNLFPPVRAKEIKEYEKWFYYAVAKCWNILYTVALAKRLEGTNIEVFCANGGHILTKLLRHITREEMASWGWKLRADGTPDPVTSKIDMAGPAIGCKAIILAAFDPAYEGHSGSYINMYHLGNTDLDPQVLDPENAEKIWQTTLELLGGNAEFDLA